MVLIANSANAVEFVGMPRVVDGDTLTIGAAKIRLQGIDAPETDQASAPPVVSSGHVASKRATGLLHISQVEKIRCVLTDIDAYGPELALCSVAGEDLNGWMVREGWALAMRSIHLRTFLLKEQAERDRADDGKAHSLRLGIGVTATTRLLSSERSAFLSMHNHLLPRSATEGARRPNALLRAM